MKVLSVLLFASLASLWAQTTQPLPVPQPSAQAPRIPDLPDDTVIAVFDDGTKFTMADFKKVFALLSPDNQRMALLDRKAFLEQWSMMRKLSQMAEKEKLDEESPTREQLAYTRMQIMMEAKMQNMMQSVTVQPNDILQYYNTHREKYKQVKVKAIYIAFSNSGGKKALTEEQAKAKANKLLSEIRSGADFVKLVKENSDDATSRAKNGDFYTLHPDDNVPESIRKAVFALKPGEVTEPLRQPNGIYLLRAEEVTYRPFSQVRDAIFQDLKQQAYNAWWTDQNRNNKVQFTSPEFLGLKPLTQ